MLQGKSYRICLYIFSLSAIHCKGKDQLTDWKMSKDRDTCNNAVCLHFLKPSKRQCYAVGLNFILINISCVQFS